MDRIETEAYLGAVSDRQDLIDMIHTLRDTGGHESYCDLVQYPHNNLVQCDCDWPKVQLEAYELIVKILGE